MSRDGLGVGRRQIHQVGRSAGLWTCLLVDDKWTHSSHQAKTAKRLMPGQEGVGVGPFFGRGGGPVCCQILFLNKLKLCCLHVFRTLQDFILDLGRRGSGFNIGSDGHNTHVLWGKTPKLSDLPEV